MNNITLVLANDMVQGESVIQHYNLNSDKCAVINEASYLDEVNLIPNETVYVHVEAEQLLMDCMNKLNESPGSSRLNIKIVKP